MDTEHAFLAKTILSKAQAHNNQCFLVAIAGAPGSGKTTIAKAVQQHLNTLLGTTETIPENVPVALMSMDGFHLSRAQLDKLDNREEAYRRRGAPWTFNVEAFVDFVRLLRGWADKEPDGTYKAPILYAPTFDHQTKDPVQNGTSVHPGTSIIILEGNYLLYDKDPWREVASLVDLRVFVEVDLGVARERLARRHVEAGIEGTMDDGYARVDGNDYLNGVEVSASLVRPDVVIRSS